MRLIVAGSRTFNDYERAATAIALMIMNEPDSTIISGGARGADAIGERYAKEIGLSLVRYPADWNKYGRSAGYIRNEEMARNADALIAFWDGSSRGTQHMINLAHKYKLRVVVVRF